MSNYNSLTAAYYAEFVEFAYQMYLKNPTSLTPPTPPNFPSDYTIVAYINAIDSFADDKPIMFYGYYARSTTQPEQIVIAIRGTDTSLEWMIDFEIWPTSFTPIPAAGNVEYGFYSVFDSMTFVDPSGNSMEKSDFLALIPQSSENPGITIVGHSLGAAIATMFAMVVLNTDPTLNPFTTLYTFASPALGDKAFAAFFNTNVTNSFRVWNQFDIVPRALNLFYTQVNNDGIEIIQTESQFDQITLSFPCEHALTTYLWLLNPDNLFSSLFTGSCQASNPAAIKGRKAVRLQAMVKS